MLEQYLKLDQRSESINYHCIMLWSSLVLIIWADKFVASKKYNFYNFHLDDQNHWCLLMVLDNKHWLLSEKPLLSLLAHFYHKIIDSLLYTNKLSAFVNSWGQFQMLERILNFFFFGKISKNLNFSDFIMEGMVLIMFYFFDKLSLHVKLVIYTMNICHKSYDYLSSNLPSGSLNDIHAICKTFVK